MEIRRLGPGDRADANLKNQPFRLWGRMIPALDRGTWTYTTETWPEAGEMCFPDVAYDPGEPGTWFFGAYDGDRCVGLAVLRRAMFRYLYLDDLKVDRDRRGQGVGRALVRACLDAARKEGAQGVYTVGQDNNLSACLFYLGCGFAIGGFNNRDYRGTSQEDKGDIYFYRDV